MLNVEQIEIINKSRSTGICDFWMDSLTISSNTEIENEFNSLVEEFDKTKEEEIRSQINILIEVIKRK